MKMTNRNTNRNKIKTLALVIWILFACSELLLWVDIFKNGFFSPTITSSPLFTASNVLLVAGVAAAFLLLKDKNEIVKMTKEIKKKL